MTPKIAVYKIIIIMIVLLTLVMALGCNYLFYPDAANNDLNLVRVKITAVIDGDTAYALFPDGREEKVRFIGVDAPEINHPVKGREPYGYEAELYTRSALEGRYV